MRISLNAFGILFLVIGALLFLVFFVTVGINDAEWGRIFRTGLPSHPELYSWAPWKKNDGTVNAFSPRAEEPVNEYRKGLAHNPLFSFTIYEGRNERDTSFPASGPHWGASYNYSWAFGATIIGMSFIALSFFCTNRNEKSLKIGFRLKRH
jgi:hypothetical protein